VDWRPIEPLAWLLLAASGLCFGLAQACLARAFRAAPAALLTPFTYTQIVPAVALGYALFGAVPDFWAALGTAVVVGAGLHVLHRRRRAV
jgi:drug/metabolite transporter (DMT)-like permease